MPSPEEQSAMRVGSSPNATAMPLSVWNQCNYRNYVSIALCFPFAKYASQFSAIVRIKAALQDLGRQRPDFAGRLRTNADNGEIYLETHDDNEIPFEGIKLPEDLNITYDYLQKLDFHQRVLTHPSFLVDASLSPSQVRPVTQVRLSFIDGGLLLFILAHHSFTDGDGLRMFLECFAACTRGALHMPEFPRDGTIDPLASRADDMLREVVPRKHTLNEGTPQEADQSTYLKALHELLKHTPEFTCHPGLPHPLAFHHPLALPPESSPRASTTFMFSKTRLESLRELLTEILGPGNATTLVTLAALTWAHVTQARKLTDPAGWAADTDDGPAQLHLPVNWRRRVTGTPAVEQYFGSTSVHLMVRVDCNTLLLAANGHTTALASVASCIHEAIQIVDDDFVARRSAVMTAAVRGPGPQAVGLSHEPRNPRHLIFNSWRTFGADTEWDIPGVGRNVKPTAIRPARGFMHLGLAQVMPGRSDEVAYVLNLGLPAEALTALVEDQEFMKWIGRALS